MKWCDTVKAAIMHGPLPPDVNLDVPHWRQPGMPLLCATDFLAPAPLKRKRVESKTDPASIHAGCPTRRSCGSWTSTLITPVSMARHTAQPLAAARHLPVRSLRNFTGSRMEPGRDSCAHGSCRCVWVDQEGRISPCLRLARLRHGHTCCKHEKRHVDIECLRGEDRPSAPSWTTLSAQARVSLSDALDHARGSLGHDRRN